MEQVIDVSIHTELWALAVTYFYAGTSKHPFHPTRFRNTWFQLALRKPDGCLCIDEKEEYAFDLYGYNRLTPDFVYKVFNPLLIFMISDDANFTDYFCMVESYLVSDLLQLFDALMFRNYELPYQFGLDSLDSIIKRQFDYAEMKIIGDSVIYPIVIAESDIKRPVPKTQKKHHKFYFRQVFRILQIYLILLID